MTQQSQGSLKGAHATQGADTVLPFACPADHFLPMKHLDNATEVDVPYRMTGFLSVYEQVRDTSVGLVLLAIGHCRGPVFPR